LEHLAKVSAETRGYNNIVDPLNLSKNFNFMLQNSIIATEVSATMYLNQGLVFRHEKNALNSKTTRIVGNCTKESTITFEYYAAEKEVVNNLKHVYFQVQINFTKLDGTKCMRILSKMAEVTHNREEAEKHVNVNVIGLHSQAQAAQLATEGQYTKARMVQKSNMRMVRRTLATGDATDLQSDQYNLWNEEALRLNSALKNNKITERKHGIHYDSAAEDNSGSDSDDREEDKKSEKEANQEEKELERARDERKKRKEEKMQIKFAKKAQLEQERKQRRTKNDDTSNVLYQAQNPLFSNFTFASNPLYEKKNNNLCTQSETRVD